MREESISEDYPLNASLKRKKKSKGGKMKKVMGLLVLLGCIAAFSWYAGVFEEDMTAIEGGEEGNTDSTAHGGRAAAALGKMFSKKKIFVRSLLFAPLYFGFGPAQEEIEESSCRGQSGKSTSLPNRSSL